MSGLYQLQREVVEGLSPQPEQRPAVIHYKKLGLCPSPKWFSSHLSSSALESGPLPYVCFSALASTPGLNQSSSSMLALSAAPLQGKRHPPNGLGNFAPSRVAFQNTNPFTFSLCQTLKRLHIASGSGHPTFLLEDHGCVI